MTHADSVITLLARLDVEHFPPDERMSVATVQVEAIEEWLAAYLDSAALHPRP